MLEHTPYDTVFARMYLYAHLFFVVFFYIRNIVSLYIAVFEHYTTTHRLHIL